MAVTRIICPQCTTAIQQSGGADYIKDRNLAEVKLWLIQFITRTVHVKHSKTFIPPLRAAFAAACAERLLSAIASFVDGSQNDDVLKSKDIAGRLWLDLEGSKMVASEVEGAIEICTAINERN
jgi:hypothetical protein